MEDLASRQLANAIEENEVNEQVLTATVQLYEAQECYGFSHPISIQAEICLNEAQERQKSWSQQKRLIQK